MKSLAFIFLLLLGFVSNASAQSSVIIKNYVAQYKDIAMQEMIRTGVPASITLAQGILETEAGQSKLVKSSNNHFGIKCKSDWTGEKVYHDDDARGECFRKYDDPTQSYKDHSDFLKNRPHYASLFNLDPSDYESWAYGLKKAGYATNPKYPQLLIKLIRDYNLQDYTLIAMGKKAEQPNDGESVTSSERVAITSGTDALAKAYPSGVFRINDTKVVFITRGTSYLVVAREHNVNLSKLFEFNDMEPLEEATKDHLLYLHRKRKSGAAEEHVVQVGESLWDIAQAEGIRMESLLEYNYLRTDVDPSPGRKLYLREAQKGSVRIGNKQDERQEIKQIADHYTVHTVGAKETLYAISKKYGVTVSDLMKWNDLEDASLKPGQQLRINK